MRIKHKPGDFRVKELLVDGYVQGSGRHRVYRVTKRKRTTLEAAAVLAELAGIPPSDVGLAGLKDRQGITTQFMSVPVKRALELDEPDLTIVPVGYADEALTSEFSTGNAFELTLRDLSDREVEGLDKSLEELAANGLPNYFGEQRFGNLRFGQGWIARELALGRHERALKSLLCAQSEEDSDHHRHFKSALAGNWGDWRSCREIAGKFGAHHTLFEHLARNPQDFAGAFTYVSSRVRLIHLYAWQSHIWNRAVANLVREITPRKELFFADTLEGKLFFSHVGLALEPDMRQSFRVPGPGLEDVKVPHQRALLEQALGVDDLKPEQFRIEGVSGFALKGEERELILRPRRLRTSRFERDLERGTRLDLSFELPRGAYATLVVQRLFPNMGEPEREPRPRPSAQRPPRGPRSDRPDRSDGPVRPPRSIRPPRPDPPRGPRKRPS